MTGDLTDKQRKFCDEYLIDCNATRAYKAAYSNVKKDSSAAVCAAKLLRIAKVQEYINQQLDKISSEKTADAKEVMEYLTSVMRGEVPDGYFKQITLTFNPWSATSWLKPRFFDVIDDDIFTKTTTWKQNEWLDDADRNIFLKMQQNNPRRYRIEGDGEWGIAEGLIYEKVRFEDFDIDAVRAIPGIKAAFGLDFGFTDPNAFVCLMIDNTAMKIYVFDEWYKTGVTNKIIAQAIKDKGYGGQKIICDSAEPKSIAELQEEGIKAEPSRKGKDSVNHGIQLCQNYEIIVHERNCPEFKKEIQNYCWETDKDGKPTDKPDHEFSHGMDSMRYATGKILVGDTFSFD